MYNQQLEELIDAALEDGVLTEKEKQVLFKKAQAMGVDLDEFEMVLDARLVKKQKEDAATAAKEKSVAAPKSDKFGDIKKCPVCGAIISNYQIKCPECGYEFSGIAANLSSQKLADTLKKISDEIGDTSSFSGYVHNRGNLKNLRMREAIRDFPVPNTKADLIEFISSLLPKIQAGSSFSDGQVNLVPAYKMKINECINKAEVLCPNDKELSMLIEKYRKWDKEWWKHFSSLSQTGKICTIGAVFILFLVIVCIISNASESADEGQQEVKIEMVNKQISNNDLDGAYKTLKDISDADMSGKVASSLIDAFIEAKRLDDADDVLNMKEWSQLEKDGMEQQICKYYVDQKDYKEAEKYLNDPANEKEEYRDLIENMCQNNYKSEAGKFLKSHESDFDSDKDFYDELLDIAGVEHGIKGFLNSVGN
jgi:competence protein ComGC